MSISSEEAQVRRLVRGGSADFWKCFRVSCALPLAALVFELTWNRKSSNKASVAGCQCGSAAALLVYGTASSLAIWFSEPSAPVGVAAVPLVACGVFAPGFLFFGVLSYLQLTGRHRRSSLHIVLSTLAALYVLGMALLVVLGSIAGGMWLGM